MPAGEYSQITDIPGQANKGEAEALAGAGDVSLGFGEEGVPKPSKIAPQQPSSLNLSSASQHIINGPMKGNNPADRQPFGDGDSPLAGVSSGQENIRDAVQNATLIFNQTNNPEVKALCSLIINRAIGDSVQDRYGDK